MANKSPRAQRAAKRAAAARKPAEEKSPRQKEAEKGQQAAAAAARAAAAASPGKPADAKKKAVRGAKRGGASPGQARQAGVVAADAAKKREVPGGGKPLKVPKPAMPAVVKAAAGALAGESPAQVKKAVKKADIVAAPAAPAAKKAKRKRTPSGGKAKRRRTPSGGKHPPAWFKGVKEMKPAILPADRKIKVYSLDGLMDAMWVDPHSRIQKKVALKKNGAPVKNKKGEPIFINATVRNPAHAAKHISDLKARGESQDRDDLVGLALNAHLMKTSEAHRVAMAKKRAAVKAAMKRGQCPAKVAWRGPEGGKYKESIPRELVGAVQDSKGEYHGGRCMAKCAKGQVRRPIDLRCTTRRLPACPPGSDRHKVKIRTDGDNAVWSTICVARSTAAVDQTVKRRRTRSGTRSPSKKLSFAGVFQELMKAGKLGVYVSNTLPSKGTSTYNIVKAEYDRRRAGGKAPRRRSASRSPRAPRAQAGYVSQRNKDLVAKAIEEVAKLNARQAAARK